MDNVVILDDSENNGTNCLAIITR